MSSFLWFFCPQILAHRGKRWILLQNACRTLWNCAHTLLLRTCAVDHSFGDHGLLTIDLLQSVLWQPFYLASDCLLDMMAVLQSPVEKPFARVSKYVNTNTLHLSMCLSVCMYMHACVFICICLWINVCVCVCMSVCLSIFVCVYLFLYMCICFLTLLPWMSCGKPGLRHVSARKIFDDMITSILTLDGIYITISLP